MEATHVPVLLSECLDLLVPPRPDCLMVDLNLGEGGHAEAFLGRYPELRYVGVDADAAILERAKVRLAPFGDRIRFEHGFSDDFLSRFKAEGARVGVALFDLGVSMYHFKDARRGFSFMEDEVLDMRLDPSTGRSASVLLADMSEEELAGLLATWGEEPYARRIAAALVRARGEAPIATSGALADLVKAAVPAAARHGRTHPATRTFQALRIAVNDELGRAERALRLASELLVAGGVLGVITFHSLEDGLAKRFLREACKSGGSMKDLSGRERYLARKGRRARDDERSPSEPAAPIQETGSRPLLESVNAKPVEASAVERQRNPASRSAKLRVARKPLEASLGARS